MNNMKTEICKTLIVHEKIVNRVRDSLPGQEVLAKLTDLFKVFGDPTRVKILKALLISEMCVCDLSVIIGSSQSAISHQLRILRQSDLVKYRKEGKVVFYSIKDNHIKTILDMGQEHVSEKI